ncbi:MAG: ferritin-like domain-containing protein [Sulfuritalea sp.]|nr:ferritin-like domain-containing protein [Sulfuritalea sp.]
MLIKTNPSPDPSRRSFLGATGGIALSGAALALLAGHSRLAAAAAGNPAGDVGILNVALGLEHEAIAAYQVGAESGLLQKPVLDIAVLFQSHHKGHRDALVATIEKMGGKAVMAKSNADYAAALGAGGLKSQADVLTLAARLELGAVNAYLGVIPSLGDKDLAKVAARLAADETMHWSLLANALGKPVPVAALSFGA